MTKEQRQEISNKIDLLIGTYDEQCRYSETLSLSERIKANKKYNDLRDKLFKMAEKNELKTSQMILTGDSTKYGTTPQGKKIIWIGNNGMTKRSQYCGTLTIDGETIFTSGTILKVFEYMINN